MNLQKIFWFFVAAALILLQGIPHAFAGTLGETLAQPLSPSSIAPLDVEIDRIYDTLEKYKNTAQAKTLEVKLQQVRDYLNREIPVRVLDITTRAEALRLNSVVKSLLYRGYGSDSDGLAAFADIHHAWRICMTCSEVNYAYGVAVFIMDIETGGDGFVAKGKRFGLESAIGVSLPVELNNALGRSWRFPNDVKNMIFAYNVYGFLLASGKMQRSQATAENIEKLKKRITELAPAQPVAAKDAQDALALAIKSAASKGD